MKLDAVLENYQYFTGSLSSVNRQLAFAGIAVVWIFIAPAHTDILSSSGNFLYPLIAFVSSLFFDLLHYIIGAATWGIFHRTQEKKGHQLTDDVPAPRWLNWAPLACFWSKIILTLCGYAKLFQALIS